MKRIFWGFWTAFFITILAPSANGETAKTPPKRVVASSFGFDAADSTEFLQAAIDSGAKTVVVDKRESDWIVSKTLKLRSDLTFELAPGVEIVAKSGAFRGKGEALLSVSKAENVTIRGAKSAKGDAVPTLRMKKREYWAEPYEKSEWRHGISILSAKNVRVENLRVAETGGDGIYLGVSQRGVPCREIAIKNVECVENNRQGISVISVDGLLIEDCVLRDTNGTAPESGIDFEPNRADEQISRVAMRRVVSENNAGDGFQFYLPNLTAWGAELSFEMEDCRAVRNGRAGFALTAPNGPGLTLPGKIAVKDCDFFANRLGISIRSKSKDGAPFLFRDVRLTTPSADANLPADKAAWAQTNADSGLALIGVGTDSEPLGGIKFDNLTIVDDSDWPERTPLWTIRDATSEGLGVENVRGTIREIRRGKTTETTLDDAKIRELYPALTARRVPAFDFARLNAADDAETSAELAAAWREFFAQNAGNAGAEKPIRTRNRGTYWFFAEKGETTTFALRQRQVGKSALQTGSVAAISPNGTRTELAELPATDAPQKYELTAIETGWHSINVTNGAHSFEISDASTPILTAARPNLNVIYTAGEFCFYVPKNADDLGVRIVGSSAERVTATLFDPSGREVWRAENAESLAVWTFEPNENGAKARPEPGFWRIRFEKPTLGVLEDYVVTILGVPALLRGAPSAK